MERDSVSGIGGPSSGGPTHLAPSAPIGSVTLRPLSWPLGTPKGPESGEGQSHTSASKGPADDDSRDDDGADGEKEEWVTWTNLSTGALPCALYTQQPVSLSPRPYEGLFPLSFQMEKQRQSEVRSLA